MPAMAIRPVALEYEGLPFKVVDFGLALVWPWLTTDMMV